MSKKRDKGKFPPFIAVLRYTFKSPAWKATSVGARAMFVTLKSNYNSNAQNAVFLSARAAAKEFGVHKDTASKWLHELEHYGFIVEVQGAHLGVSGVGKAARYRLTDCGYAGQPPTYDFEKWDGVLFSPKKQNPVLKIRTPRPKNADIRAETEVAPNGNNRPKNPDIRNDDGCPKKPAITSLTISLDSEGQAALPLRPVIVSRTSGHGNGSADGGPAEGHCEHCGKTSPLWQIKLGRGRHPLRYCRSCRQWWFRFGCRRNGGAEARI